MNLRETIRDQFSSKKMPTAKALVYFQAFYSRMLNIIGVVASSHGLINLKPLASIYTRLHEGAESIINRKDFVKIKINYVALFQNLSQDTEGIFEEWESVRGQAFDFLAKIEQEIELTDAPTDGLASRDQKLFDKLDDELNKVGIWNEKYFKKAGKVKPKIKLKDIRVSFDDTRARLLVGKHPFSFYLNGNEHKLCRIMFSEKVRAGDPIPFNAVEDEFFSGDPELRKEKSRTVYYTIREVNRKIADQVELIPPLLKYQNEHLIRQG